MMFKFAPGKFVEPSTIGLKVLIEKYNGLFINVLPGRPMRLFAVPCRTNARKTHANIIGEFYKLYISIIWR